MSAASTPDSNLGPSRRDELLAIAAGLFAERGFKNTTVRDIADAAGILSGSLYHHFDSKESMVDEILRTFQSELFENWAVVLAGSAPVRQKMAQILSLSFEAIHDHYDEVAIFQNDSGYLMSFERFAFLRDRQEQMQSIWLDVLRSGIRSGELREDLDLDLTYRFVRDTVWVAVKWYRPGGSLTHEAIADRYLTILLDGIAK